VRALLVHHDDLHADGLRDDEDVGKDDGRVDEAVEPLDRLQRDGRRDLGRAAALKKVPLALRLVVLWQIAPGWRRLALLRPVTVVLTLPHHPHGRPLDLFAWLALASVHGSCGSLTPRRPEQEIVFQRWKLSRHFGGFELCGRMVRGSPDAHVRSTGFVDQ
jgi:hypothetical protein